MTKPTGGFPEPGHPGGRDPWRVLARCLPTTMALAVGGICGVRLFSLIVAQSIPGVPKVAQIVIRIFVLLFAIIVHEVSHGLVAEKMGDPTARRMGRLTLNPIPHIDLFGSIIIPGISPNS